jgi:hypothetical protein
MDKRDVTIDTLIKTIKGLVELKPSEAVGASFFVLAEDENVKNKFIKSILELRDLIEPFYQIIHRRSEKISFIDVTSNLKCSTLEDLFFPKSNENRRLKDFHREANLARLGRIVLVDNAQDLTMNTKKNQQLDMSLVRGMSSNPHDRIMVLIGTKSMMKMVDLDERLGQKSILLKLI